MCKKRGSARSRQRLIAAATELLDNRDDVDRVTVTTVVETAGVTRPTFYAVFDDLPSAFAASAITRLSEAFAGLSLDPETPADARSEQMLAAFTEILERLGRHGEYFTRVLTGPAGPMVHDRILDFIARRLRENSPVSGALAEGQLPLGVSSAAVAAGVVWTIRQWLRTEPRPAVTEAAAHVRLFVENAVIGGLGDGATTAEAGRAEEGRMT